MRGTRTILHGAAAVAVALAMTVGAAHAATIESNIAGTQAGVSGATYRPFHIDTSTVFQPEWGSNSNYLGPVNLTGTIDVTGLASGSTVYVGLISVDRYNEWISDPTLGTSAFLGFIDTAYVGFQVNNGRIALGQQWSFGETVQTYVGGSGHGPDFDDWSATFDETQMTLQVGASNGSLAYTTGFDYIDWFNAGDTFANANRTNYPIATDWSSGAYAFVGTWFNGAAADGPVIDVTFSQSVVPEPATMSLLGLGLGGLALRRLRKRA